MDAISIHHSANNLELTDLLGLRPLKMAITQTLSLSLATRKIIGQCLQLVICLRAAAQYFYQCGKLFQLVILKFIR